MNYSYNYNFDHYNFDHYLKKYTLCHCRKRKKCCKIKYQTDKKGPTGPTGPDGTGQNGSTGPTGTTGITGYRSLSNNTFFSWYF